MAVVHLPKYDWLWLNACDQIAALNSGQLSSVQLLECAVARADSINPVLNAVVTRDFERARTEARHSDERRARGEPVGVLAGLPMTVKDHFDLDDWPSSFGGDARLLNRQATDAAVIERVRHHGGVIWGRTNLPFHGSDVQTYNVHYGTTNNPWDLSRTPGGSSGGSAVSVASGISALELGSDIGGSLRIPAAFCGVMAHKPTWDLVPQRGFIPAQTPVSAKMDMAVIGPIARSARDLRLLLSLISDRDLVSSAPAANIANLRLAFWIDEPTFPLDPEIMTPISEFAKTIAAIGADVRSVRCPVDVRSMLFAYVMLLFSISGASIPAWIRMFYECLRWPAKAAVRLGAGPVSAAHGIISMTARHRDWLAADEVRARMKDEIAAFFAHYDAIITPVAPVPAFPHDRRPMPLRRVQCSDGTGFSYLNLIDWVALPTLLDLPATIIPVANTRLGLPVAIQIIGAHGRDDLTLAIAQAIEERFGGFRQPPIM